MPRPKLGDEDVARLRELYDEGYTMQWLAERFGVSRQQVGRILRGERRASIGPLDAEALSGGVARAVAVFLEDVENDEDVDLDAGDAVLAVLVQGLAVKIDGCVAADSAAAAHAVPRLAAQLVDVLDRLRGVIPHEPDAIDKLRRRRDARRLAVAASNGGGAA